MLWGVIMAGGSGDRFWPKSRKTCPKQLLPIISSETMIQLTADRLNGIISPDNILIITNSLQREEMIAQLPFINPSNIIAEPVGRDTAACIGLAALLIKIKDPDGSMLILPADHVIHEKKKFQDSISAGFELIEQDNYLVTFGIKPSYSATGYGYIQIDKEVISSDSNISFFKVNRFVEKPDLELAEKYLKSGNYYWNSGMFIWKATVILGEIQKQLPLLYEGLNEVQKSLEKKNSSLDSILQRIYPELEKKSIDYGIMEKAENVVSGTADFDWDDIGSWESIGKHFNADKNGNVCIGNVKLLNCSNTLVYNLSQGDKLLTGAVDIKDQVIVQTDDAVLVCPKSSSQKVKQLVEKFKEENLDRYL